jgi:hypothetical protein
MRAGHTQQVSTARNKNDTSSVKGTPARLSSGLALKLKAPNQIKQQYYHSCDNI